MRPQPGRRQPGCGGSRAKPSVPVPRSRPVPAKVCGTVLCPHIHHVPLLEPLACEVTQEQLKVLFSDGLICTWAWLCQAFADEGVEGQAGEGSSPRLPAKSGARNLLPTGQLPRGSVV